MFHIEVFHLSGILSLHVVGGRESNFMFIWIACPSSISEILHPFLANLKYHLCLMFKCPCIYGSISGSSAVSH